MSARVDTNRLGYTNLRFKVSGDGKLSDDSFFSLLEIYLVSSETNINLTVVSGTDFLSQESGSVRHENFMIPTCIKAGNYNVSSSLDKLWDFIIQSSLLLADIL